VSDNLGFAQASSDFLIAALLIYSLAVIAFAGDYAFGRPRRTAAEKAAAAPATAQLAAVGAGTVSGAAPAPLPGRASQRSPPSRRAAAPGRLLPPDGCLEGNLGSRAVGPCRRDIQRARHARARGGGDYPRTRGPPRPLGNMYEFITALTCVAAIFFGYIVVRYRAWALGVFVMGAVVLTLGLAETLIYTPAGPLVPALQSYWLSIHVTAMTLATGNLLRRGGARDHVPGRRALPGAGCRWKGPAGQRADRAHPVGGATGQADLPDGCLRVPRLTFGVIAGAIWADQAWGRYWGWDPVETWAFITWVIYAAYLHARATAGWRGARAHYIQLIGFVSLVTNMLVVQVFITGMHSYAGVSG